MLRKRDKIGSFNVDTDSAPDNTLGDGNGVDSPILASNDPHMGVRAVCDAMRSSSGSGNGKASDDMATAYSQSMSMPMSMRTSPVASSNLDSRGTNMRPRLLTPADGMTRESFDSDCDYVSLSFDTDAGVETCRTQARNCGLTTWNEIRHFARTCLRHSTILLLSAVAVAILCAAPQTHFPSVATSAAASRSGAGIFELVLAFLAGGLFFSAFAAAITASLALGKENIRRFLELATIVASRVWYRFCHGLLVAWETFNEGRWREIWRVLREQLRLTRQAAREGVEAIKLEANLYAAAAGKPVFLQHLVDHFTPKFIASMAETAFIDTLQNIKNSKIRRLQLLEFSFGKKSPQLTSARMYELGDDAIAFDVDVEWESDLRAKLRLTAAHIGMTVPVVVKNVRFDGVVRCILTPLTPDPPGFGAALISFPVAPAISFDIRIAGRNIAKMPWIRTEVMRAMQKEIAEKFLWPNRVVISSPAAPSSKPSPMLSDIEIQELSHSDPLLRAERELADNHIYQTTQLKIREIPSKESLRLDVLLKDETGAVREGENTEQNLRCEHSEPLTASETSRCDCAERHLTAHFQGLLSDALFWRQYKATPHGATPTRRECRATPTARESKA